LARDQYLGSAPFVSRSFGEVWLEGSRRAAFDAVESIESAHGKRGERHDDPGR
jgi:hypothetical protein